MSAVRDALEIQDHMRFVDEGARVLLSGRFDLKEADEAFALEIQVPTSSPRHLPTVWEVGDRIPRVPDPHHVSADGSLCVQLEEAYWYHFPRGLSLAEFIQGPLPTHLAGQLAVLRGDDWPMGEWEHDGDGRLQFYREILGTSDQTALRRLLLAACDPITSTYLPCPCGSGRKLRKCHGARLNRIQQSPTFSWIRDRRAWIESWANADPKEDR